MNSPEITAAKMMKEYGITFYLVNGHRIITKESGRSEEGVLTSMRRGQGYKFVRTDGIYISIPDHAVAYISVYEIGGDQE